jgi:hypothetical protein
MMVDSLYDLLFFHEDGQLLAKLVNLFCAVKFIASWRDGQVGVGKVFDCVWLVFVL